MTNPESVGVVRVSHGSHESATRMTWSHLARGRTHAARYSAWFGFFQEIMSEIQ